MSKRRSKTSDFSLELKSKKKGNLPSKEEIDETIKEAKNPKKEEKKVKRIPFTTALTPKNRAMLESAAYEGKESIADILNKAIGHYFDNVQPLQDSEMQQMFLKLFRKKAK